MNPNSASTVTAFKRHLLLFILLFSCMARSAPGFSQSPEEEFFETKIRPLLAEHCYSCHSTKAEKLQAGLYLDSAVGATRGGDSGPAIVPGKPDESLLIRAVRYEENEMPPDRKLSDAEIALLTQWVEAGAPWPSAEPIESNTVNGEYDWNHFRTEHWSFRPVARAEPPKVNNTSWPLGSLDHFIAARLEATGLSPGAPAALPVLVRRIYIDLTGLLPTPDQVQAFVSAAGVDQQAAVSDLVNRLLDSPRYGERWGRHWLDVARFSDGLGGFSNPRAATAAWRYRDWVVKAFNDDMPYDRFLKLQIAGDLLEGQQGAVATGFFALGPAYKSDGGDPDSVAQAKGETLDDRIDTLSRGLLALTASCARCHDHKFDPIPQQDYYSLAGIFNNTEIHDFPLAPSEVVEDWNRKTKEIDDVRKQVGDLRRRARKEKRQLNEHEQAQKKQLQDQEEQLKAALPPKYPVMHILQDTGSVNMPVAIRGNMRKPGAEAPRRFLRILSGEHRPKFIDGSGRLQLADAVAAPANPLTARVIVNRIWMHHFGKALVRSPSNFGISGEEPSHPLLLDWLASELIDSGWSIKSLHRVIMTSATWQQSSTIDPKNFEIDGDNRLVWRMNPRRMDVEVWRDCLLFVTNDLDLAGGGPPFEDPAETNRRTLYAKVSRNGDQVAADAFLRLFDFPLMKATIAERPMTIVPQQFLFMMNSEFMVARAQALAKRLKAADSSPDAQIERAYQLLFGRRPNADERSIGEDFLTAGPGTTEDRTAKLPILVQYAQVLLSSNEFMYVR